MEQMPHRLLNIVLLDSPWLAEGQWKTKGLALQGLWRCQAGFCQEEW